MPTPGTNSSAVTDRVPFSSSSISMMRTAVVGKAEIGVVERDEVHRIEQAEFPSELELERVAYVERPLKDELAGDHRDIFVANLVGADAGRDAQPIALDRVLIAHFYGHERVGIVALRNLQPPDIVSLERIGTRHLDRILAGLADDVVVGEAIEELTFGT